MSALSAWWPVLPAFLLLLALVLVPGLAMAYAVGLRGLVGWGLAPALGLTGLSVSPIAARLLSVPWTPGVWLAGAVAWVVVAWFVGLCLRLWWQAARRPRPPRATPDSRGSLGVALAAIALGVVGVLAATLSAIGRPDELVDSTDVVAHLNRLRAFVDSGSFSSIGPPTSYPSAFHDLAGTTMLAVPSLDLVAAANLTALAGAAVFWPLGCVALARQAFGRRPVVLLGAGLASASLTVFPFVLMGWGVLWPNLLATAILPGVLGPALIATGTIRGGGTGAATTTRTTVGAATLLALPGLTLTHPNGAVSLGMLVVLGALTTFVVRALGAAGRERSRLLVRAGGLVVVSVAGLLVVPRISRQVADTASYAWDGGVGVLPSLSEVVLLGLQLHPQWVLVAVLAVGVVAAARRRRLRWVVAAWAFCVLLYVLAATTRTAAGVLLTGYWYNDKVRLAALTAVPAVLLITLGIAALARVVSRALSRVVAARAASPDARPATLLGARGRRTTGAAVALVAFVLATFGLAHGETSGFVDRYYHPSYTDRVLLTATEDAELGQLAAHVPVDAVVADVPANGSGLLYALHGRKVLYDSLLLNPDEDSKLLAEHLDEVATRTDVCDAARRLGVQYAVTGTVRYWLSLDDRTPGISGITSTTAGFDLVAEAGRYRLWRIDACGFGTDPTLDDAPKVLAAS